MKSIKPLKKRHSFGLLFCLLFAFLASSAVYIAILIKQQKIEGYMMKQGKKIHEQQATLQNNPLRLQTYKSLSTPVLEEALFVTSAKKCVQPVTGTVKGKSQEGEDAYLMEWFRGLCGGTYIEMGALDGKMYSNSFIFNKSLQWKGVLIEMLKRNYDKLVINRPDEIATINAAVCDKPQKLHYVTTDRPASNGIYEFASPSFRDTFWGKDISLDDPKVQEIECDTLDGLLLKNEQAKNINFFDFFSLDVEGAELAVLQSTDFDRIGFGIIFAEVSNDNLRKNSAIRSFLESKGYIFVEEYNRSYWFMNAKFHQIYKDLIY